MVVWKQKEANCTDTISQVYLGLVKFYEYRNNDDNSLVLLGNSIIMLDEEIGLKGRRGDQIYRTSVKVSQRCLPAQVLHLPGQRTTSVHVEDTKPTALVSILYPCYSLRPIM